MEWKPRMNDRIPKTNHTVAVRLAGPMQSWGLPAAYDRKPTLPYPTLSGIMGIIRAAHGLDRQTSTPDHLMNIHIAVRIDQQGTLRTDFHTINAKQKILMAGEPLADKENIGQVTLIDGKPWKISKEVRKKTNDTPALKLSTHSTKVTYREYLTDAAFTLFLETTPEAAKALAQQLETPYWPLSLGRKSYLPDQPFVLGVLPHGLLETAEIVPMLTHGNNKDAVPLHILKAPSNRIPENTRILVVDDAPTGPHPYNPRISNTRHITKATPPIAETYEDLLTWIPAPHNTREATL
jgi:CRISPR system Cascade subunit CasD